MKTYVKITARDVETADKLEARVRVLADQAGVSYERLVTIHAEDSANPGTTLSAPIASPGRRDGLSFADCVLVYFDAKPMLTRFNRVAGSKLAKAHRPLIERFLADAGDHPPQTAAWKSDRPDERTAQLFIAYINELVWLPLVDFAVQAEAAADDSQKLARLRRELKTYLKHCHLWHQKIDALTRNP